ncbi:hypothetical protein IHE44_0010094 [Lamprotornis superbus]|uniref:Uncharacterized protein n=1 Tax=Lamprotornis superbus TaxID=245042 RepID=A0A835TPI7_9PASS|nr:hypothetical protein IHE44_0010094 [Lamprotornis superbus]
MIPSLGDSRGIPELCEFPGCDLAVLVCLQRFAGIPAGMDSAPGPTCAPAPMDNCPQTAALLEK